MVVRLHKIIVKAINLHLIKTKPNHTAALTPRVDLQPSHRQRHYLYFSVPPALDSNFLSIMGFDAYISTRAHRMLKYGQPWISPDGQERLKPKPYYRWPAAIACQQVSLRHAID